MMDRKWVDDGDLMLMSSCHDYLLFSPAAAAVLQWGKILHEGGLISESFSLLIKSPKMPNHYPEHYPLIKKTIIRGIWHLLFGDLSQCKKLSEIKPTLIRNHMLCQERVKKNIDT